jgi:hypothetical protein
LDRGAGQCCFNFLIHRHLLFALINFNFRHASSTSGVKIAAHNRRERVGEALKTISPHFAYILGKKSRQLLSLY